MHPVGGARVVHRVRVRQPQIPRAPGFHDDPRPVQVELDLGARRHRDMDARAALLDAEIEVGVLQDPRTRRQPHQPHRMQSATEMPEDLLEIRAILQDRRVGEFPGGRVGIDHHDRMGRARLAAQRDDAPLAVVVLFDEMLDPVEGRRRAR